MILSNVAILEAIRNGDLLIDGLGGSVPTEKPFNTTAVDLRLGAELSVPNETPTLFDLRRGGISGYLQRNSTHHSLTEDRSFTLEPNKFVLGQTQERIQFPIKSERPCYCARVEGRSSIARCGILVHFTAPTIHAGFEGKITLEIINLGANAFLLSPGMYICQLIIEQVMGTPENAPNQFKGQTNPSGIAAR